MIPINRRAIVTGILMTVVVMLIPESVDACPNCKDGLLSLIHISEPTRPY